MSCGMLVPGFAQEPAQEMPLLLEQISAQAGSVNLTPEQRVAAFSALAALPADTDSYIAVRGVGRMLMQMATDYADVHPLAGMATQLDGLALGVSDAALQDMKRCKPLLEELVRIQAQASQGASPTPEDQRQLGEKLVEVSKDFRLSPLYVVLSTRPGAESMLQGVMLLPFMIPQGAEIPFEVVMDGNRRGICLRGDRLDLSKLKLLPEHEQQLRQNLSQVRLYALMQMQGNCLVLTLTTQPAEVKLPATVGASLAGTANVAGFDALLQKDACCISQSSATMVSGMMALNKQLCWPGIGTPSAAASSATPSLPELISQKAPSDFGGQSVIVWKDDAYYVHGVAAVNGLPDSPECYTETMSAEDLKRLNESHPGCISLERVESAMRARGGCVQALIRFVPVKADK